LFNQEVAHNIRSVKASFIFFFLFTFLFILLGFGFSLDFFVFGDFKSAKNPYISTFFSLGQFLPLRKGRPKPWTTFFSPSLRCSQFGNDPQFNLANFDYPQDNVRE
jgi:hypothetical protein